MTHATRPNRSPLGAALREAAPAAPANMVSAVMASITADRAPVATRPPRRRWAIGHAGRALALACALATTLGAGVGATRAAAASLPGDPVYGVRLLRERASMALAPSASARAAVAAGFAQDRLDALHAVVARHGDLHVVVGLMTDAVAYATDATVAAPPWMDRVLGEQYRAAARDCARLGRDPLWRHTRGVPEAERALDGQLDALARL